MQSAPAVGIDGSSGGTLSAAAAPAKPASRRNLFVIVMAALALLVAIWKFGIGGNTATAPSAAPTLTPSPAVALPGPAPAPSPAAVPQPAPEAAETAAPSSTPNPAPSEASPKKSTSKSRSGHGADTRPAKESAPAAPTSRNEATLFSGRK
jgi:hypothetical protein